MDPTGVPNIHLWLDARDTTTFAKGSGESVVDWSSKVPTETTSNAVLKLVGQPQSVVSSGLNGHLAIRCIDKKHSLGNTNFNVPIDLPLTLFLVVAHITNDETLDAIKTFEIGFNSSLPDVKNFIRTTQRKTTSDVDNFDISYTYITEVLFNSVGNQSFTFESSGHKDDIGSLLVYELHARTTNDFDVFVSTKVNGIVNTYTLEFGLPDAPLGVWSRLLSDIVNTAFGFTGDIGEILIYKKDLSLIESNDVRNYIFERWA